MGLGTQFEQSENAGPAAAHSLSRLYFAEASEILTADASAENLAWLKVRFAERAIRFCDAAMLHAKILARFDGPLLAEAVYGLQARDPALSARTVVTSGQICIGVVLLVSLAVALALAPLASLRAIIAVLSLAFVASGLFRALLAFVGGAKPKWPASPASCDAGLPTYTILVPLYHEARVALW